MDLLNEIHRCGKCGICIQTCPVYAEDLHEWTTPRGKVQLLKSCLSGDLSSTKKLQKVAATCLMCGSCTHHCPSGIDHESLFMAMRKQLREAHGESWSKNLFFYLLSHEQQLKRALKLAGMGQNPVFEALYKNFQLGNISLASLPRVNPQPFREQRLQNPLAGKSSRGSVLYFVGCSTNYAFSKIGNAVVQILNRMGLTVELVPDQVCCGLPMYLKGELDGAVENARKNIALFNRDDVMAVITDCATCTSALSVGYKKLLAGTEHEQAEADSLASNTINISRFIIDHFDWLEDCLDKEAEPLTITAHIPCHERNHMDDPTVVPDLLRMLPHVNYVEAENAAECCGGGGTFFYDFPELSGKMAQKKVQGAMATGAELWVTGCPGCRINLTGYLQPEADLKVVHPVEVIAAALRPEQE